MANVAVFVWNRATESDRPRFSLGRSTSTTIPHYTSTIGTSTSLRGPESFLHRYSFSMLFSEGSSSHGLLIFATLNLETVMRSKQISGLRFDRKSRLVMGCQMPEVGLEKNSLPGWGKQNCLWMSSWPYTKSFFLQSKSFIHSCITLDWSRMNFHSMVSMIPSLHTQETIRKAFIT